MNEFIFREYDIRGIYPKDIDLHFAETLGRAFFSFIKKRTPKTNITVTVGYDARISSPDLCSSLTKGLVESGATVLDLGLITSPISYFSTFTIPEVVGAIMITGSHNPPDYNGFKISFGKTTIHGSEIQELKNIIKENKFIDQPGGSRRTFDIFPKYIESFKNDFGDMSSNNKYTFDCGNGAAGVVLRRLTEALNIDCDILFEEPDGLFPNHHPDPTVEENLGDLKQAVLTKKSSAGIGFDGDSDRIGVVDNKGRMIYGDELMIIYSRSILPHMKGAHIVGDVKCSSRMYDEISLLGGTPVMWKTGHSLVKNKIKEVSAPFGGELSGHIFFADRNFGYDDAIYAAFRLIEIINRSSGSFDSLFADIPPSFSTPEIRLDTDEKTKIEIVDYFKSHLHVEEDGIIKINQIDGTRVDFEDGWALVRSSNTQPVIVFRFESKTELGLTRISNFFQSHLKGFNLSIPV